MTRLARCKFLKEKGYTYNPETGKVFGIRGKELKKKDKDGYFIIGFHFNKKYDESSESVKKYNASTFEPVPSLSTAMSIAS